MQDILSAFNLTEPNELRRVEALQNHNLEVDDDEQEFFNSDIMKLREKILSAIKSLQKTSDESVRKKIIEKTKSRLNNIKQKSQTAKFVRTRDKLSFLLTTVRLVVGAYMLGRWPCWYPNFHLISAVVLLGLRLVYYRYLHYHYFLLDFCYYANLMMIIHLHFFPESTMLHNVSFAFANGPLLLAVPMFQNSLVPHSLDKVTSNFIHLSPALTLMGVRTNSCAENPILPILPFSEYLVYSMGYYLLWAVPYYLIMFVFTYERSIRKNNVTLYNYSMGKKNSFTYKFCGVLGERFRPVMFMFQHLCFSFTLFSLTYVSMLNVYIWISSIIVAASCCVWNGATYYIDFFSIRYQKDIEHIEDLAKELK